MIAGTLSEAARVLGGLLHGSSRAFRGVSTDTRSLAADELFFALRGPRFDGHDMLAAAATAGAAGAVVEHAGAAALARIEVADTRRGLAVLARDWRARFAIPVIGITGSAGKTTVKEMLGAIMLERGPALITAGNLNNDIGVPQTLFRLGPDHAAAVIEMGASQPGDIAVLVDIARPTIGVVTLAAASHLEGLGDVETVARTKGDMLAGLGEDGVAVYNADDAFAPLWAGLAGSRRCIRFGRSAEVRARNVVDGEDETTFTLCCPAGEIGVRLAYRGRHNVDNALAASAAALAADASLEEIARGLARARPLRGRLRMLRARRGTRVIDDCYNANPASLGAALEVLATADTARWLVLGDMGELGDGAVEHHRAAGRAARAAGVSHLFALGPLSRSAVDEFGPGGAHFEERAALIDAVGAALDRADGTVTILVKGSRMMALEAVVESLTAEEPQPC